MVFFFKACDSRPLVNYSSREEKLIYFDNGSLLCYIA
jgi:hypothetical protein